MADRAAADPMRSPPAQAAATVAAATVPKPVGEAVGSTGTSAASPAPDLQAYIGQELRAVYQQVLDEPVPDRFVALLASLGTTDA